MSSEKLPVIKDDIIIIHNAEFDLSHINNELKIIGKNKLNNEVIDTLILAGPLVNSFYFCANGSSIMTFDINGLTSPPGGSTNITMQFYSKIRIIVRDNFKLFFYCSSIQYNGIVIL